MKHWLVKMKRALDKVFMTLKNKIEKQKHTRKRGWSSNTKAYYNLYYKKKKKKKKTMVTFKLNDILVCF